MSLLALPANLAKRFTLAIRDTKGVDEDNASKELSLGVNVLVAFFVIFLGWAALAPLDAAVVGQGFIVSAGNRQTVQHRDGGVISRIAVKEGQHVQKDDILVELADSELLVQEQALKDQVIESQMERTRLIAEASSAPALPRPTEWASLPPEDQPVADAVYARYVKERDARKLALSSQIGVYDQRGAQLNAAIAGYKDQITSLQRQRVLLNEELAGVRTLLEKQLVPITRVRALERALADLDGREAALNAQIVQSRRGMLENKEQASAVSGVQSKDDAGELRSVDARLAEMTPRLAAVRMQLERARLRAPATGSVVGMTVHTIGGVVRPGEPLMDIVPDEQSLIVEAKIRPEDADDISVGQKSEVRITAFTGRRLPLINGAVRQVSADRFVDEHSGAPYFLTRVEVEPKEVKMLTGQQGRTLRAGLPATIVVATRKRTALQYLIEPLNQRMWSAFREQ